MTQKAIIQIAILDDHQIVIDGLKLLLSSNKNFEIIHESNNGFQMIEKLMNTPVDILLTDIMMPDMDGFEVAMMLQEKCPEIKVIALTMNGEGSLIHKMMEQTQIVAYLLKTIDKNELIHAIEWIHAGNTYFPNEILEELEAFKKIKKETDSLNLTAREIEIIKCIARDMSNKQIAEELFISERTVETHRKNVFRKTDIHSAIGLVEFAKKRMII